MHTLTYRAVLTGNRLEWQGETPPEIGTERSIPVDVTIVAEDRSDRRQAGERMAAALEKLAGVPYPVDIDDPVSWQRESRRDRQGPGRD